MIPVTKPYLPNIDKYKSYIDEIYKREYLTNNGPLVKELEERLSKYLGVKNVICVANGTLALQVAYKALNIKKKAITTPFTFIATASSLSWEGIQPVFSDIEERSLTLDPKKLELITDTSIEAVVPVHVYGNICDVEAIDAIAKEKKWKVIYDAAHAFGCQYKNNSILNYGDISTLSFHATKLFHSIEGGALIVNDDNLATKVRHLINFGLDNGVVIETGINAKMSEFHAAMGLCVLDDIDKIRNQREERVYLYLDKLNEVNLTIPLSSSHNSSYFPVLCNTKELCKKILEVLEKNGFFPRRYFYPPLDQVYKCRGMPIADTISERVLCLPLYPSLEVKDILKITELIKESL
jgi:dTDP-4-amino-4,6-dideoxygalactose transaminase